MVKPVTPNDPPSGATDSAYENDIKRLIVQVKAMSESDWSPTPLKKGIEAIAGKLLDAVNALECDGSAQTYIEEFHDKKGDPDSVPGADGYPVKPPPPCDWLSYQSIAYGLRALLASAKEVVSALPNPREKPALPYAALCLVHLRLKHGYRKPLLSNVSDEVMELKRVSDAAGIYLSEERLRGALSDALGHFDPHLLPSGLEWLQG